MTCIGRGLLILVFCKVAGNRTYTNPDRPLGRSKGPAQPGASRVSGSRLHGVVTATECRSHRKCRETRSSERSGDAMLIFGVRYDVPGIRQAATSKGSK